MARRAVRGSDAHMNVDEFASLWSRPDDRPPSLTIANGRWFDGRGFDAVTMHTVDGRLSRRRPRTIDGVVDLAGMYVVPPFGEAHNHNLHSRDDGAEAIRRYLAAGVFYVLIANNLPTLARGLRPMLNTPTSVDAVFAHGGLTASDGHPIALWARRPAKPTGRLIFTALAHLRLLPATGTDPPIVPRPPPLQARLLELLDIDATRPRWTD